MTGVIDRFSYRMKNLSTALVWLISAIFFFVVTYFGFVQVLKQMRFGMTAPALQIPLYVFFLPIPVFSAIMGFRSLLRVIKALFQMIHGEPPTETVEKNDGGETS